MNNGRTHWEGCHEHHHECALIRLAEARADAERYRWILHQAKITDFIFKYLGSPERHVSNAIDAAMLEE